MPGKGIGRPRRPKSDLIPNPKGGSGFSRAVIELQAKYLDEWRRTGSPAAAREFIKRDRRTVQMWRARNPVFNAQCESCAEAVVADFEVEAKRRAVEGVERPMVSGGKVVAKVREYSDSLLSLLLRANAPEKYRPRIDPAVSVHASGPIRVTFKIGDKALESGKTIDGEAESAGGDL